MRDITKKPLMNWTIALLVGLMLIMSGCTSRPDSVPTATAEDQPEAVVTPVEPTPSGMDDEDADQGQQADEVEQQESNQCLICHTDQQTLIDTADPEPVVEEESTGEG